ncbi:MAG: hypothetical protein NZL87_06325, partial [Thermomicrobium sp.]|nr:hypothetical protein [Thermomicrobium sp.]
AQRPTAATTATAVVVSPPSPAALPTATPVSEAAAGEMVPTPPGASPAASPSLVLVETTSPAGSVLPTTGHPVAFLSWILLAVGAFFAAAGALLEYRRGSGRAG